MICSGCVDTNGTAYLWGPHLQQRVTQTASEANEPEILPGVQRDDIFLNRQCYKRHAAAFAGTNVVQHNTLSMEAQNSRLTTRSCDVCEGVQNVKQLALGGRHLLALTHGGRVATLGSNEYGLQGLGSDPPPLPSQPSLIPNVSFEQASYPASTYVYPNH